MPFGRLELPYTCMECQRRNALHVLGADDLAIGRSSKSENVWVAAKEL